MGLQFITVGTRAEAQTSVAPAVDTALTEVGDILVLFAYSGNSTAATPTIGGGWTSEGSISGGAGAWGLDSGPRRVTAWSKIADSSDVAGATHTVSLAAGDGNSVLTGGIATLRSDVLGDFGTHGVSIAAAAGSDTTLDTTWHIDLNGFFLEAGGIALFAAATAPDSANMSSESITTPTITTGTLTQEFLGNSNLNGHDLKAHLYSATITAGSDTINADFDATLSSNSAGAMLGLHAQEVVSQTVPGPTASITLTSPAGGVTGHVEGPTATVTLTAPAGGAAAHVGGPTASITLTAPAGNVTGHVAGVTAAITVTAPVGGPAGMGWFFYPPTVLEAPLALDRKLPLSHAGLFERYKIPRGISVLVEDGNYIEGRWFDYNRINDVLAEGGKYYDGGHRHGPIPDPERADLIAAGYEDNLLFEQITFGKVS